MPHPIERSHLGSAVTKPDGCTDPEVPSATIRTHSMPRSGHADVYTWCQLEERALSGHDTIGSMNLTPKL